MNMTETRRISSRSDRKSTRLNSSHVRISYAVFCLKKKKHPWNQWTVRSDSPATRDRRSPWRVVLRHRVGSCKPGEGTAAVWRQGLMCDVERRTERVTADRLGANRDHAPGERPAPADS